MRVEAVWRDSRFLNKAWGSRAVTSYWVRVRREELAQVMPLVSDPEDLETDIAIHSRGDVIYLLVARDLSSIVCLPDYYPDSGQWNGRSPFEEVTPVEIKRLEELKSLAV